MIQVYKFLHNLEDIPFTRFFELNENLRGHAYKLKKKSCQKDVRKNFFSVRLNSSWNGLPDQVVTAPNGTLNTFKNRLDKFMGDKKYTVFPENPWVFNREGIYKLINLRPQTDKVK